MSTVIDPSGQAHDRYAGAPGTLYLIRPDGYVLARWHHAVAPATRAQQVRAALQLFTGDRHDPCATR
jgi:3-(3-hydroxy-phenyl)propionate hydroxylase